jgi:membrane protein YqaA with SNARE-associated domain
MLATIMKFNTIMKKFLHYALRFLPVFFVIGFSVLFYYPSPEYIIGFVGAENAYVLIFILALIGGLTTFSGVPYHIILIGLAAGGLDPYLLGFVTAIGVMLGDSTSYYIGYQGRALISPPLLERIERWTSIKAKHPHLFPFIFFCYGALLPLSNDIITIPMGILRYSFWKTMIPLGFGNLIFNTVLAVLAAHAYEFVLRFPFIG